MCIRDRLLTKWENVDGNVESYSAHKQINTNNTQKQNNYKRKQWKKPDREQNSSKFSNHKVASVAEDNQNNEHGPKKTHKVARRVSMQNII